MQALMLHLDRDRAAIMHHCPVDLRQGGAREGRLLEGCKHVARELAKVLPERPAQGVVGGGWAAVQRVVPHLLDILCR